MRLTRRGWAVVLVIIGLVAMAWQYGPRALNAVVTPLLVVVVAGAVTTALTERPRVSRSAVDEGHVGESRTVTVTIETNRAVSATVRDAVGDGLSAADPTAAVTLDGETEYSYELALDERGDRRIGPLSIVVVDLFGLVKRRFTDEETTSVLVYPPVYDLRGGGDQELQPIAEIARRRDREEFDHLREYQRGDSLRDVHWKSAAKRPGDELVVAEYADTDRAGSVTVAAECSPESADEMAATAASVATYLLECGGNTRVELLLPDERQQPKSGHDHHRELLAALAIVEPGELDAQARTNADVLVQADADEPRIVIDGQTIPFDRLRDRDRNRAQRTGGRADQGRADPIDRRRSGDDDGTSSGVSV